MKAAAKKPVKNTVKVSAKQARKRVVCVSVSKELDEIGATVKLLRQNPDQSRQILVQAGIYTPKGKLTKAFGG